MNSTVSTLLASVLLWIGAAQGADSAPFPRPTTPPASTLTHGFKVNNGLVGSTQPRAPALALGASQPEYTADLPDPQRPGQFLRVELHWLPVAGTNRTRPVLWEPGPRCMTALSDPNRIDVHNWVLNVDAAGMVVNDECRPTQRIGALAGVGALNVLLESRGEHIQHRIGIGQRSVAPGSAGAMLIGNLRPSAAIAARRAVGRFAEKALIESGFASLDGIYLVTGYGIFKGTERASATGGGGFEVITTTDLYRAFRPGDLFFKVSRNPGSPLQMRLIERDRAGDGSRCPDTDGRIHSRALRLVSMKHGVRIWQLEPMVPRSGERQCVLTRVNNRTCRVIDCVQWSDSLNEGPSDGVKLLTDNEAHARRLHASLPALTLASTGMKHDSATWSGTVRERRGGNGASPWGECGLEGCDARRRREQIEQFVIDQWNR